MNLNDQPQTSFIFDGQGLPGRQTFCGFPGLFDLGTKSQNDEAFDSNGASKEKEDLDKYLAESMNKLSFKDREAALEEVHGIAKTDPEDPMTLACKFAQLDAHIASMKHRTFYEKTESMDPSYVSCRDFRLMFLRCNRYDPKAAAAADKVF